VGGDRLAAAKSRTARIHSCVDKRTRLVHIVGPHKSCRHSQYSKSWNIRGLQGPPGQPGPAAAESFRTQDVCVDAKGDLSIAGTTAQGGGATTTAHHKVG